VSARLVLHWTVTVLAVMAVTVAATVIPGQWGQTAGVVVPLAVLAYGCLKAPAINSRKGTTA
jgi:hypothetical protein